jgi:hypothetical protein
MNLVVRKNAKEFFSFIESKELIQEGKGQILNTARKN